MVVKQSADQVGGVLMCLPVLVCINAVWIVGGQVQVAYGCVQGVIQQISLLLWEVKPADDVAGAFATVGMVIGILHMAGALGRLHCGQLFDFAAGFRIGVANSGCRVQVAARPVVVLSGVGHGAASPWA